MATVFLSCSAGTFGQASDLLDKRIQLLLSTPAFTDDPEPLFMIRRAYDACVDTGTALIYGQEGLRGRITKKSFIIYLREKRFKHKIKITSCQ